MKILVTGDRNYTDADTIRRELRRFTNATIIHGAARGADSLAGLIAHELGFQVRAFPANWTQYGRAAGPIRNTQMLNEQPDLILAFHKNIAASKGTKNMINQAIRRGGVEVLLEGEPVLEEI